jgi:hypothetical protein
MAAGPDLGSAVVAACLLSWSRLLDGRLDGREPVGLPQANGAAAAGWRACPAVELSAASVERWGKLCCHCCLGECKLAG